MSNSADDRRVLWNQSPELLLAKDSLWPPAVDNTAAGSADLSVDPTVRPSGCWEEGATQFTGFISLFFPGVWCGRGLWLRLWLRRGRGLRLRPVLAHIQGLPSSAQLGSVLGSWVKTMRDAVRNKER